MGGAVEQVVGGVVRPPARGTGRVSGYANPLSIRVEERAKAGAELGQGSAVGAGKGKFFALDRGRGALEDTVWFELTYGRPNRCGMEVSQGGFVGAGVCCPTCE